MAFPLAAAITGGLGFVGGLLDDSAEVAAGASTESARINALKTYPGQRSLASILAPYLSENLGVGLTKEEKDLYRGSARTSIDQAIQSSVNKASSTAASQGLRGGSIADILTEIENQKIPAYNDIEKTIFSEDLSKKRKTIADILSFLNLKSGNPYTSTEGGLSGILGRIIQEIKGDDELIF